MATITSAGSGNWSAGGTWVGGVAPTAADAAVIANTHTVTLDTTGCVCLSLTVNSGGTLTASTTATSDLTVQDGITLADATTASCNIDLSASPTYSCSIYVNNADSATARYLRINEKSALTLKGYPRKRKTTLTAGISAGATSATVTDATGWQIGDTVIFATTQAYNATPKTDVVTLTSVSGGSIGWTGGITYDHASGGYVGNFSSNVKFGPGTSVTSGKGTIWWVKAYGNTYSQKTISNVLFLNSGNGDYNSYGAISIGSGGSIVTDPLFTIEDNAFYQFRAAGVLAYSALSLYKINLTRCVFYSSSYIQSNVSYGGIITTVGSRYIFNVVDCGIFRISGGSTASGIGLLGCDGVNVTDTLVSSVVGTNSAGIRTTSNLVSFDNIDVFSNYIGYNLDAGSGAISNMDNGVHNAGAATNSISNSDGAIASYVITDSNTETLDNSNLGNCLQPHSVTWVNKNNDVTSQEIYRPYMSIKRDNSNTNRSTSSIAIYPTVISTDCQRTLSIPCANGSSIRIVGYVKKSHATNVSATVALTGLGSSVTPFAKANDTAWEMFDLSATNSSGNDGNFTLTYTANSSSGTTNVVYFDGVPDSPFVTKCRHYGFLFDEAQPIRTVDPYSSANEATAAAYTGVTINNTTKQISFASGTADTAQKFYDYSRWWCCDAVSRDVPFTRAGTLYSMTTGWTVVDPYYAGSLTWSGGTVQYTATGTKSDNLDGCIVEFDAVGTFTFDGSLSGTLDLRNLGASAITVEVPSSATTTTANNTGGTITVIVVVAQATALVSGLTAGSRIQIYNVTEATEIYNDIVAGTSWSDSYPDGTGFTAGDVVRVRVAWMSGVTAKKPEQYTTIATAAGWSVLAAQLDDAVYNLNAIDGDTVTEFVADYPHVQIDVDDADGATTPQRGYAWYIAGQMTADGIAYYHGAMTAEDEGNYRINVDTLDLKLQNISASPVFITGARLYRSDGSRVTDTGTGNIEMEYGRVFTTTISTSDAVISGTAAEIIAAIPSAAANATATLAAAQVTPIHADARAIKGKPLGGEGVPGDEFHV